MKLTEYVKKLIGNYKGNTKTFRLFLILRFLVLLTAVRCLVTRNFESFATCLLVLLLFLVPAFIEDKMDLTIPPVFQAIIFSFIFAAEILGEVDHYYVRIPGWDTILHTINGFLFAAVGFSLIYLLNRGSKNFNVSPFYMTVVAFCFSMTIGVLWEFFECGMDIFFGKDMQKDFFVTTINSCELDPAKNQTLITIKDIVSTQITTASGEVFTINDGYLDIGILDTMKDLFVNFIGAVVFCIFGLIYETVGNKSKTAAKVVEGLRIKPADE